jgi:phage N-6-adenine-methyltransferase
VTLVRFRARNHRQQVLVRGASAAVDDRATSPEVFGPLDARFSFTLDVAASAHNTKCERFFSIADDGLEQSWAGERVWCNPPYSDVGSWVEKAWAESETAELIVLLLPANRTEQNWWQEMIEPYRDRPGSMLRVEFLRGRLRFIAHDKTEIGPNERPPFGCCLLIWYAAREGEDPQTRRGTGSSAC